MTSHHDTFQKQCPKCMMGKLEISRLKHDCERYGTLLEEAMGDKAMWRDLALSRVGPVLVGGVGGGIFGFIIAILVM